MKQSPNNTGSDRSLFQKILPVLGLTLIVLLGYHKVFLGADFFLYEDPLAISNYSFMTGLGNGWRPDKGFGVSLFFGDPGIWHPWSLFSWLERLAPSRVWAYNFSVVALSIGVAITMYFFIRKIAPSANRWSAVFLSPVVVFCSSQAGIYFLRHPITLFIGMLGWVMVLYGYYQRPKLIHFFIGGALFWAVLCFGNLWSVFQLLTLGFFFSVFYYIYFKGSLRKLTMDFFIISLVAMVTLVFLSLWLIYPLILEKMVLGYMREKVRYLGGDLLALPNLKQVCLFLIGLFQVEWIPLNHNLGGFGFKPLPYNYNVFVAFPLVFIHTLFRRPEGFWEFTIKWLLIIFLIHTGLSFFSPAYDNFYSYITYKTSKIISMYDSVIPFQVGLMALFLAKMDEKNIIITNRWGRWGQRLTAGLLAISLGGLTIFAVCALSQPGWLPSLASKLIQAYVPGKIGSYPKELVHEVAVYNIQRFQELMRWHSLVFYVLSILLVVPFLKDQWLIAVSKKSKLWIAGLVVTNVVLYSWTVYPLNEKGLFWEQRHLARYAFQPTDRFYFVKEGPTERTLDGFRRAWSQIDGGGYRQRQQVGLLEPPGLNLSGLKSFDARHNGEFIYHIFNGDGRSRMQHLRDLYYGGPLLFHELLDMSAVKYYYSNQEIHNLSDNLVLFAKERQLYVYLNKNAWPYYYLAKQLSVIEENQYPRQVQQGTAYLWEEDLFEFPQRVESSDITMKKFSFGELIFDFKGTSPELLVVADSWHPFWRARAKGKDLPVIKANGIFKGVKLPAGEYQLRLFFDTRPYKKGIPVCVMSWFLFLAGFVYAWRHRQRPLWREIKTG